MTLDELWVEYGGKEVYTVSSYDNGPRSYVNSYAVIGVCMEGGEYMLVTDDLGCCAGDRGIGTELPSNTYPTAHEARANFPPPVHTCEPKWEYDMRKSYERLIAERLRSTLSMMDRQIINEDSIAVSKEISDDAVFW